MVKKKEKMKSKIYAKQAYISNLRISKVSIDSNSTVLYLYGSMFVLFGFLIYKEVDNVYLMMKIPFLWIGLVIFLIGGYIILQGKTTLKGIKPIYQIIGDFFTIVKDNTNTKYNKKNYVVHNELKDIEVKL